MSGNGKYFTLWEFPHVGILGESQNAIDTIKLKFDEFFSYVVFFNIIFTLLQPYEF